jgi:hypothetical protein
LAVGIGGRTLGGDEPGGVLEVLDGERDASQRAHVLAIGDAGIDRRRVDQCRVAVDGDEGAELVVIPVDPVEGGLHDLAG